MVVIVSQYNVRAVEKEISGMNYLIFVKHKDKMELTESWLSTHDFLPLAKTSNQRHILLSLSEFLLFSHEDFMGTYCILVFYYFSLY